MTGTVFPIHFHSSAGPQAWAERIASAFRLGQAHPALHYQSPRQALRWMDLHQRYSPATRGKGRALYTEFWNTIRTDIPAQAWLISLGCGTGEKELPLLAGSTLAGAVAQDISPSLIWTAREHWLQTSPQFPIQGLCADLSAESDWASALERWAERSPRVVTFFGLLPQIAPATARRIWQTVLRPGDWLAVSANLAPANYSSEGLASILPQYDNAETRRWLGTLLEDADLPPKSWSLEVGASHHGAWPCVQVVADIRNTVTARWPGGQQELPGGTELTLFISQRPSAEQVRHLLEACGLKVICERLLTDEQEGLWWTQRS